MYLLLSKPSGLRLILIGAFFCLASITGSHYATAYENWNKLPERLIIAMDGVPYEIMTELQSEGHFTYFHPVSRMVSSFPSITDVAFAELFDSKRPEGYQRIYYSYGEEEIVGGISRDLFGLEEYETGFHTGRLSKLDGTMLYISSGWAASRERTRLVNDFWKSRNTPDLFAIIRGSDLVVHRYGHKGIMQFMAKLDADIIEIRKRYRDETGKELSVIIVSDHGNTFIKGKRVRVKDEFSKLGINAKKKISDPDDVVSIANGIVSYLPLYTLSEPAPEIARRLVDLDGVDAIFFTLPDEPDKGGQGKGPENDGTVNHVRVINSKGEADLLYDSHADRARYDIITGDPLDYGRVMELAREKRFD